jgi:hypothetical protein
LLKLHPSLTFHFLIGRKKWRLILFVQRLTYAIEATSACVPWQEKHLIEQMFCQNNNFKNKCSLSSIYNEHPNVYYYFNKKKKKKFAKAFIILLSKGFSLCSISFSCTTQKNYFLSVGDWTILRHAQGHSHTNHNQGDLVRSEPSLLLRQNSTIEYWNMLTFEPPHICFSNNSTWTCSKLPFKFPKPVYHNKEKEIWAQNLIFETK